MLFMNEKQSCGTLSNSGLIPQETGPGSAQPLGLRQVLDWDYEVADEIFTCTERFYSLHGTTTELEGSEAISRAAFIHAFVHPEDARLLGEEIAKAVATEDARYLAQFELRILRRDGKIRHVLTNIAIAKNLAGETIRIYGIEQDISDRKRSEKEIQKLWRGLEKQAATVIIADVSGKIEYVNPRFVETTGYSAAEAIGKNPRVFKSGLNSPSFYRKMWDTLLEGKVWQGQIASRRKSGEIYCESASITPIRTPEGKTTHYLMVKVEVANDHQNEEDIRAGENIWQDLFTHSSDAIITLEPPFWTLTSGNPAALKMFGAENESDLISRGPWEFSPDVQVDGRASAEKAMEMIETALAKGAHAFDWVHKRLDGTLFHARVVLSRTVSGEKLFLQATIRQFNEGNSHLLSVPVFDRGAGMKEGCAKAARPAGGSLHQVSEFCSTISEKAHASKIAHLVAKVARLRDWANTLKTSPPQDGHGNQLLEDLETLSRQVADEHADMMNNLGSLSKMIDDLEPVAPV
jgi:PAS domain S-box-containing protein